MRASASGSQQEKEKDNAKDEAKGGQANQEAEKLLPPSGERMPSKRMPSRNDDPVDLTIHVEPPAPEREIRRHAGSQNDLSVLHQEENGGGEENAAAAEQAAAEQAARTAAETEAKNVADAKVEDVSPPISQDQINNYLGNTEKERLALYNALKSLTDADKKKQFDHAMAELKKYNDQYKDAFVSVPGSPGYMRSYLANTLYQDLEKDQSEKSKDPMYLVLATEAIYRGIYQAKLERHLNPMHGEGEAEQLSDAESRSYQANAQRGYYVSQKLSSQWDTKRFWKGFGLALLGGVVAAASIFTIVVTAGAATPACALLGSIMMGVMGVGTPLLAVGLGLTCQGSKKMKIGTGTAVSVGSGVGTGGILYGLAQIPNFLPVDTGALVSNTAQAGGATVGLTTSSSFLAAAAVIGAYGAACITGLASVALGVAEMCRSRTTKYKDTGASVRGMFAPVALASKPKIHDRYVRLSDEVVITRRNGSSVN